MSEHSRLFFGGEIYTVDALRPTAEAVAVRDGFIQAVGSRDECAAALDSDYEELNLRGAVLLPGFIDTHMHPLWKTFHDMSVDLRGVKRIEDVQDRFRTAAAKAAPGEWITGMDFSEEEFASPRMPDRRDLDVACPDHPAIIIKHDGHSLIANTLAIRACGVSAATPDPEGGLIDREPDGYPAGPFRETAMPLILESMPIPDMGKVADGYSASFRKLASRGITSIGAVFQTDEEGPAGASGAFELGLMSMFMDRIPINLYGIVIAKESAALEAAMQSAVHTSVPGGHRVGAIKIFSDGSFATRSAFMNEPFCDRPGNAGMLITPPDEIYRRMVFAHRMGLQIAIHAIGDAAVRTCVDLYEKLLTQYPRADHRHRIEHASVLNARLLADIARLGLVISTQPLFIHSEKKWLHKILGSERASRTYPFRSILDAGIPLAGASDAPVEETDVLHAIECCVTREGYETQQSISAAEAVRMFTLEAAYAQFEEHLKGSITVGKRADFALLTANPTAVKAEEIHTIRVLGTYIAGEKIFG